MRPSGTSDERLSVIPAQTGIQGRETSLVALDARFRGHDEKVSVQ
jgi:hypothetical protein